MLAQRANHLSRHMGVPTATFVSVIPRPPRWVMVFLIVFIALALLFVILHLTGNGFGDHMHMSTLDYGVGQQ